MFLVMGFQLCLGGFCIFNMYSSGSFVVENDGIFIFCQDIRIVFGFMLIMVGLLIGILGKFEWEKEYVSKMVEK